MLFLLKRRALPALSAALLVLVAGGLLRGRLAPGGWGPVDPVAVAVGLAAIGASDAILHGLLTVGLGARYRRGYRALVERFAGQGGAAILAGGALAAAEEVLFRGAILEALGGTLGLAVSSVLFGLAHLVPERRLAGFALWSTWEGVLLGLVYVRSGSLAVAIAVHALHDVGGFVLFALQRRTGWLLGPPG